MMSTLPPTRSLQRRRRAGIGHVLELHARHHLEHLGGQMRGRAVALRRRIDLAGIGLGVGDRPRRRSWPGNFGVTTSAFGMRAMHRDRLELGRIEAELRIEVVVDDQRRRRRRQQRVAVGLRLVGELGADIAGRRRCGSRSRPAGPTCATASRPTTRGIDVGGAAGRERHDDLHRAGRISPARRPMAPPRQRSHQRRHRRARPASRAQPSAGNRPKSSVSSFFVARIAPSPSIDGDLRRLDHRRPSAACSPRSSRASGPAYCRAARPPATGCACAAPAS